VANTTISQTTLGSNRFHKGSEEMPRCHDVAQEGFLSLVLASWLGVAVEAFRVFSGGLAFGVKRWRTLSKLMGCRVKGVFGGDVVAGMGIGFSSCIRAFLAGLILLVACLLCATQAKAQAVPAFEQCTPELFLMQTRTADSDSPTVLSRYGFDQITGAVSLEELGETSRAYNAAGYNSEDDYIYALQRGGNRLLRIGSNGESELLGAVAGLPNERFNAGEIAPDGAYYVQRDNNEGFLYVVDVTSLTASRITLNRSINVSDLAWHSQTGRVEDGMASTPSGDRAGVCAPLILALERCSTSDGLVPSAVRSVPCSALRMVSSAETMAGASISSIW
jgi:hypothetical protein